MTDIVSITFNKEKGFIMGYTPDAVGFSLEQIKKHFDANTTHPTPGNSEVLTAPQITIAQIGRWIVTHQRRQYILPLKRNPVTTEHTLKVACGSPEGLKPDTAFSTTVTWGVVPARQVLRFYDGDSQRLIRLERPEGNDRTLGLIALQRILCGIPLTVDRERKETQEFADSLVAGGGISIVHLRAAIEIDPHEDLQKALKLTEAEVTSLSEPTAEPLQTSS